MTHQYQKDHDEEHEALITYYLSALDTTNLVESKASDVLHEPSRGIAKLTKHDVYRIREILSAGVLTGREIARIFRCSEANISHIKSGKSWSHLPDIQKGT